MEGDAVFLDPSRNSSSLTNIYLCSLCNKPFTNESSRGRHLRYCGSRTRNRLRSCRACNIAKTKCSFETPCSRCMRKRIECVYQEAPVAAKRGLLRTSETPHRVITKPHWRHAAEVLHVEDGILSEECFDITDGIAANDTQLQCIDDNSWPFTDFSMERSFIIDSPRLEAFIALNNHTLDQNQSTEEVSIDLNAKFKQLDKQSECWCRWMRKGVSLSVMNENPLAPSNPSLMAILQTHRPYAHQNAHLVMQSLLSFPTMMLRRETFPWFIHPQSQLLLKPKRSALPEALSICMSMCQIFISRTAETRDFLWRTIRAEYRRFKDEACMIYLILFIVDYSPEDEKDGLELLSIINDIYLSFKKLCGGSVYNSELLNPSITWESWIFAESQRRLSSLWFLIGCVVCTKTGRICDPSQSYKSIPLPGPKSVWEASTPSTWETAYEASRILQTSGLVTLGDLVDTQQSEYSPSNARKLEKWNAGVDNLGSLLNLVGGMV